MGAFHVKRLCLGDIFAQKERFSCEYPLHFKNNCAIIYAVGFVARIAAFFAFERRIYAKQTALQASLREICKRFVRNQNGALRQNKKGMTEWEKLFRSPTKKVA